jgi:hypothetical protein
MHLARFDRLLASEDPVCDDRPGVLFCQVGADSRAAGTDPASRDAFVFVLLGLHADEDSADRLVRERHAVVPWLDEAAEVWSAVLQPYRHKGKANYLMPAEPGKFFEPPGLPLPPEAPTVVITSVGWNADGLEPARFAPAPDGSLPRNEQRGPNVFHAVHSASQPRHVARRRPARHA